MSPDALLAGCAGVVAVAAAWELLSVLGPLRLLGVIPMTLGGRTIGQLPARTRMVGICAFTLLTAGWLVAGPLAGLLGGALGPWCATRVLRWRRARWVTAATGGAPAAARSVADALAGGHSVRGALTEAAAAGGCGPATDAELRTCARALAVGATTDDALEALQRRVPSPAWATLVAAILLQRDAGGDLAALLRETAAELEQTARIEADARAATAQARFTGWIVAALPVAGAALTELASPGTIARIVSQPLALSMAAVAVVLQGIGMAAIRSLAK